MSRSIKKGPFVDPKLLKKIIKQKSTSGREPIKTWARCCTIVPEFIGHNFAVHDGRKFVGVFVSEAMVGHKLGEFAPTRTFRVHGGRTTGTEEGAS